MNYAAKAGSARDSAWATCFGFSFELISTKRESGPLDDFCAIPMKDESTEIYRGYAWLKAIRNIIMTSKLIISLFIVPSSLSHGSMKYDFQAHCFPTIY